MATFAKQFLSGSTDGRAISVVATATPGTTIHTADASAKDEIWLWATNTDPVAQKLTIEWGGVVIGDLIEFTVPAEDGAFLIIPGWILSNSLVMAAFAATTVVINVAGYVNRIT